MRSEDEFESDPDDPDLEVIAPLLTEYFKGLSGKGGRSRDELLSESGLNYVQQEKLSEAMENVDFLFNLTAPIREANERRVSEVPVADVSVDGSDVSVITHDVLEYYQWIMDSGGTHPDVLLSKPHTAAQRKMLLARMDDINVIFGITAPIREQIRKYRKEAEGQQ